ncbi:MAG: S41 family peptidase [Myxococcaceae bacterium]
MGQRIRFGGWVVFLLPLAIAAAPPPVAKSDASGNGTYPQLELFARVLSYVQNNYVQSVEDRQLVYGAIKGMVQTLDPHTVFMTPEEFREMKEDTTGEFTGLGMELGMKEGVLTIISPMDDTPAARAGVKPGDHLVKIDGEPTQGIDLPAAVMRLRGPVGRKVRLTLMREGFTGPLELVLVRDHIPIVSVEGALHGGLGYVRIKSFQERTDAALRKELERLRKLNGRELDGLVLDLRNNPGGLLDQAVAVSDRFLPGNLNIVSTQGRLNKRTSEEKSRDRDTEPTYPMVVLVNAGSASASEIVAGALQDHERAVVLGSQTFGKGSVQTVIELEDGSGLKLTIARYYTPKGRSIQELGISPDFWVEAEGSKSTTREKDLRRHFQREGAPDAGASASRPLPPDLPPWNVVAKIEDSQLRAALTFLHAKAAKRHASATQGMANTPSPGPQSP